MGKVGSWMSWMALGDKMPAVSTTADGSAGSWS